MIYRNFSAKEKKAIQNYAVRHNLQEQNSTYPKVVFVDPETKLEMPLSINDVIASDIAETMVERKADRAKARQRRIDAEAKL